MKHNLLPILLLGTCTAGFTWFSDKQEPVRTFDGKNVHVAGLGACDITSEDAQCWNMDGQLDAALTERIKAGLRSSNQDVSFRFGQKNVFLVVDNSGGSANISRSPQGYTYTIYLNQQSGQNRLDLFRINPEGETKPVTLTATLYGLPGPPPVTLNSTPGSTARVGDTILTVGTSKVQNPPPPSPNGVNFNPNPYNFRAPKQWTIAIGTSQTSAPNGYLYEVLDKTGKSIPFVDHAGKPASSLTYLENSQSSQPGLGYNPQNYYYPQYGNIDPKARIIPAYLRQSQMAVPGAFTVETDVDPDFIGAFKISTTVTEAHEIGPFPISPHP